MLLSAQRDLNNIMSITCTLKWGVLVVPLLSLRGGKWCLFELYLNNSVACFGLVVTAVKRLENDPAICVCL